MESYKRIVTMFAEILQFITDKYVMRDLPIPEEILVLKDEACTITAKAAEERNSKALIGYERRLIEIKKTLN